MRFVGCDALVTRTRKMNHFHQLRWKFRPEQVLTGGRFLQAVINPYHRLAVPAVISPGDAQLALADRAADRVGK